MKLGLVRRPVHSPQHRILWEGPISSWEEARQRSGGYHQKNILETTSAAIRKVASGEAVFERDSVLFAEPEYPWALISALHRAACGKNRLDVTDFGGSLGSTYFQVRKLLEPCYALSWQVIEQEHYVTEGNQQFANKQLSFAGSIGSTPNRDYSSSVLILSGVLNYLEHCYDMIDGFMGHGFRHILVDRTLVSALDDEFIVIQHVPPSIYEASYPCHVLSTSRLRNVFSTRYKLVYEWRAHEAIHVKANGQNCIFKGFLFELSN